MEMLRTRKCPHCQGLGHSSLDCPKLNSVSDVMAVTSRFPDNQEERPSALSRIKKPARDRLSKPARDRLSKPARDRLSKPANISKVAKLLGSDRVRKTDSYFRGEGKFDVTRSDTYPRMSIKANRSRDTYLPESDSESDGRGENMEDSDEPLTVQVNFGAPRKSKLARDMTKPREPEVTKSRDFNFQITTRPGDLRYQMKTKPLAPQLIPKYKDPDDLRFSIKRPTTESKRKKSKPPEYSSEEERRGEEEEEDVPRSPIYDVEEEEELLKEVSDIKRTTSGSVIRFDSDSEGEKENVKVQVKSESEGEGVKMGSGDEAKEEVKEEVMSTEEAAGEEKGSSSSSSSGESSSSSSGSDSENDPERKKKFIDIREKYDSKPITANSKLTVKPKVEKESKSKSKAEVKREAPQSPSSSSSSDTDDSQPQKPQKRPKTESKPRDIPLTRDQLLSIRNADSDDSYSDDGEVERAHSGALAALEDTKSRRESSPLKQKVVPIFPFKTYSKAHQFPESKVPFVDSHCHIDYLLVREQNYGSFASYVASKDFPKNFSGCVANFCDPPAWGENQMYEDILEEDGVWGAFGLHPHNAKQWSSEVERNLLKAASHPKCVAWGEMGLDYGKGYTVDMIETQKDAFMAQIKHALKLNKPFVIHGRGAEMDTFEIMKAKVPKDHRIHFHCYSGSWNTARRMLEYFTNMYLGVTGLVTFSTAQDVREMARKLPLDRMLIETDAPYMKPSNALSVDQDSPRSSSPAMCLWVAAKIAEIRRIELDDVLKQVRQNVKDMYGI